MALYALHPGDSMTATQLATAYGLTLGECITIADDSNPPAGFQWHQYINLYPRENDDYQDIKYLLGQDGIYQGGRMWREVKTAAERAKSTGEYR